MVILFRICSLTAGAWNVWPSQNCWRFRSSWSTREWLEWPLTRILSLQQQVSIRQGGKAGREGGKKVGEREEPSWGRGILTSSCTGLWQGRRVEAVGLCENNPGMLEEGVRNFLKIFLGGNKLANLEATLVRNSAHWLTHWLTYSQG